MARFSQANSPYRYNVGRLRAAASDDENDENDENDGPDPNYVCQRCGNEQHVDDYQTHTPAWCDSCEKVTHFERRDE